MLVPNVSVIIISYNGGKYIESLLDSLYDQTYPKEHMEIIVVDNCSTDNTHSLVKTGFPDVKYVSLDRNYGFAMGNNRPIQHAQYDLLVFLNVDTICHSNWLSGLMDVMNKDKSIGACASNTISPESEEFSKMNRHASLNNLYYCDLSCFGYGKYVKITNRAIVFPKLLSGCSFAIQREILTDLGYLFEDFSSYNEDTDLSLRIHNLGYRFCVVKDSVVYHIHRSYTFNRPDRFSIAAKAIMNRVYAFFRNMSLFEFLLFFPILFLGSPLKVMELNLRPFERVIYFLPFGLFSMVCILLALFRLHKYESKRRLIMNKRSVKGLPILKLILRQNIG